MSMKGFFNSKQTNQQLHTELADFKHQIKRINTLEVHMNRFLKLEPQIGSLIILKKKLEAQPSHSNDSSPSQRSTHKNAEHAYAKDKKEIANQLQFLKEKVAQLEQVISMQPPRDKKDRRCTLYGYNSVSRTICRKTNGSLYRKNDRTR
nr:hypothetical protein [Priestia megaterium]MDH3156120.1 hypothetical protein [Priestia megaterium]